MRSAQFYDENKTKKAKKREDRKRKQEEKQASRNPKPVQARNPAQKDYIVSIINNTLTFGVGPAGVGKTYIPARIYGHMLDKGDIEKIYVSRPNVSKSVHKNGYLPGTLEDKSAPWLVPVMEGLQDSMAKSKFELLRRNKVIEEVPYEYMQGRTLKNAAWIVDEAENLDMEDLYITLTRQGDNLNTTLCGDIHQARISNSGYERVVRMAKEPWMESIGVVEFCEEDVVRSEQAQQWVKAFEQINRR